MLCLSPFSAVLHKFATWIEDMQQGQGLLYVVTKCSAGPAEEMQSYIWTGLQCSPQSTKKTLLNTAGARYPLCFYAYILGTSRKIIFSH
jgi:hypothetical protein